MIMILKEKRQNWPWRTSFQFAKPTTGSSSSSYITTVIKIIPAFIIVIFFVTFTFHHICPNSWFQDNIMISWYKVIIYNFYGYFVISWYSFLILSIQVVGAEHTWNGKEKSVFFNQRQNICCKYFRKLVLPLLPSKKENIFVYMIENICWYGWKYLLMWLKIFLYVVEIICCLPKKDCWVTEN